MSTPFNQNVTLAGLNSYSVSVPSAVPYVFDFKVLLPTIVDGGGQSSVVMTITNTTQSVTIFTGTAGAQGGRVAYGGAVANDVIQFALSSGASADAGLNAVKTTIAISQGVS